MSENDCSSPAVEAAKAGARNVKRFGLAFLIFSLFAIASAATFWPAGQAVAQQSSSSATQNDAGGAAKDLDALIETLENDKSRGDFVEKLKKLRDAQREIAGEDAAGEPIGWLQSLSSQLRAGVGRVAELGSAIDLPRFAAWIGDGMADPESRAAAFDGLVKILAIVFGGFVAFMLARLAVSRPRRALMRRNGTNWIARLALSILGAAIDLVPLALGAGAAFVLAGAIEPRLTVRLIALAIVGAAVGCYLLVIAARLVLSPGATHLRLIPVADETAHYLFIWTCRIGFVSVIGYFVLDAALSMGMAKSVHRVLTHLMWLAVTLLAAIFVLQNRDAVAAAIRGNSETGGQWSAIRRPLAAVWHLLAVFYLVALYIVLVTRADGGTEFILRGTAVSAATLIVAWLLDSALRTLMQRGLTVADDVRARFPGLQDRVNRYTVTMSVALRGVIVAMAGAMILEAWGVQVFAWIASPLGQRVASAAVNIAIIVALALLTWELVSSLVERRLAGVGSGTVLISNRAKTLLPLARTALRLVLIVLVSMVILSEIGVNITPLLAGAGVIGLAVGFGAQKLVQDVITGWFILMEDTISVGDVVDLDGHAGVVERINIRTIQLRDQTGTVHTIPFSSVNTVQNMTRDFSYYVFDVGIAYKEDTDHVIEVLRAVDEEMRADEIYGPDILEPLDVLGVDQFGDSAVVIKVRTKTRPIRQWAVGREFNRRMKKAFDAAGIEIPFPQRTLRVINESDVPTETILRNSDGD